MQTLTRENVRAALVDVVAAKGADFVYVPPGGLGADCVYLCQTPEGLEASCLWGHVLMHLGMTYERLESFPITHTIRKIFTELGVTDHGLIVAVSQTQAMQDVGTSWGECLNYFDRYLKNYTPFIV